MSSPTTRPTSWRLVAVAVLVASGILGALSAAHPGLRLVDFLGFSARGHRLLAGTDLVHPLYPVGYPLVLGLLQSITHDPLLAGRLLSISAGALAVGAVTRWLGPAAGLWMLVQPSLLTFGSTEGTDLPAFALGFTALALRTGRRPALAGVSLGLAVLCRYTALALVPVILWPASGTLGRRRAAATTLAAMALTTLPHWGLALATGEPLLPDQSSNLAIGANAVVHGPGFDTLLRLPSGLRSAMPFVFSGPGVGLGAAAVLATGVWSWRRGDRPTVDVAAALLVWGGLHTTLVAMAFANTRLVLPTRLALAAGLGVALRTRPRVLAALAILYGLWTLPPAGRTSPGEQNLAAIVAELESLDGTLRTGHFLTSDPWVHRRSGARLDTGTPLREAGGDPRALDADRIAAFARSRGDALLVLDVGRVQRTYPGLAPLLDQPNAAHAAGLRLVGRTPGYRVFAVQESP